MVSRFHFERGLQSWIALVGLTALGNTLWCFVAPGFVRERLYTEAVDQATDLAARLFGLWTLVAALLRIACAFCIDNRPLYHLTFVSFAVALFHFATESFVYKTASLTMGVVMPLIVSGVSMVLMGAGYWVLGIWGANREIVEDAPKRVEDIKLVPRGGRRAKRE